MLFRHLIFISSIFAIIAASPLYAATKSPNRTAKTSKEGAGEGGIFVDYGAFSGIGEFQEFQTPVNRMTGLRADGTTPGPLENESHLGIPLGAEIATGMKTRLWIWQGGLEAVHMSSVAGETGASMATYGRALAHLGSSYHQRIRETGNIFRLRSVTMGLSLNAGRIFYRNASTGHHVDFVMPKLEVKTDHRNRVKISAWAGASADATLRYSGKQSGTVDGSEVDLWAAGLDGSFILAPQTWIFGAYEYENTTIVLNDIRAYRSLGLTVTYDESYRRTMTLSTQILTFGFRKSF